MARIPTPSSRRELPAGPNQMPSVRMGAAPTADQLYAQREPKNAVVTRHLTGAAKDLADTLRIIDARDDQTQISATDAEASKAFVDLENSWREKTLANAKGTTKDTETWLAENREKFRGRLHNERQRRAFDEVWNRKALTLRNAASRHEASETHKANGQSLEAAIVGDIEIAAMNTSDPQELQRARASIDTRSRELAQNQGWDDRTAAIKRLEHASALHDRVVSSMVRAGDTARVEAYLTANADDMNASTRDRLAKTVETHVGQRKAQAFGDEMMASDKTLAEAEKEARDRFDGDEEVRAIAEVRDRYGARDKAIKTEQVKLSEQALEVYNRTGNINSIPPDVWSRMSAESQASFRRRQEDDEHRRWSRREARERALETAERRTQTAADRERTRQQTETFERTKQGMLVGTPEDVALLNLPELYGKVSASQMTDLIEFRGKLLQAAAKGSDAVKDLQTAQQQITDHVRHLVGIKDKDEAGAIERRLNHAVDEENRRIGRNMTQPEREAFLTRMTTKVVVEKGLLWNTDRMAIDVTPQDLERLVPAADRARIRDGLLRRRMPASPANIVAAYRAAQSQPAPQPAAPGGASGAF